MPNLFDLITSAKEQVAALAAQVAAGGADWQAQASAAGDAPAPARVMAAFAAAKQTLAALLQLKQAQDQRLSAYVEGIAYTAVGAQRLNDALGDFGGSLHPRLAGAGLTQAGPSSCALALKQAVAALVDAGMDPNTARALSRIEPSTVPSGAVLRDPACAELLAAIVKTMESVTEVYQPPPGNYPAQQQYGAGD